MDTYLEIAQKVLRAARRPMTAEAILNAAYRAKIVPHHLYGKTQHKTLQARLSEYILENNIDGVFYRTDPGYFFLSEFMSDQSIPNKYKDPFYARRRVRDIPNSMTLSFDSGFVENYLERESRDWQTLIAAASSAGAIRYVHPKEVSERDALVWSFSVVKKGDMILSYRIGKYRDQTKVFKNKRTVGFADRVSYCDRTLFSGSDMGIVDRGQKTIFSDLGISKGAFYGSRDIESPSISFVFSSKNERIAQNVLFVTEWNCPNWFEPTIRRLSLNDIQWLDGKRCPNDLEHFDPWSVKYFSFTLQQLQVFSDEVGCLR